MKEKEVDFGRAKKARVEKKLKDINIIQRGKLKNNLKMTQEVREIIEQIADDDANIKLLTEEGKYLEIINKAETNRYLNLTLNGAMESLVKLQKLNNAFLDKVTNKKAIIPAKDCAKLFIKLKELENNQIKLITELSNSQQFTLEELEREIIIIFRSIPKELQKYLYKTILGFVKQCPKIQKAMLKTKQKQEQKERKEEQLRRKVENQN